MCVGEHHEVIHMTAGAACAGEKETTNVRVGCASPAHLVAGWKVARKGPSVVPLLSVAARSSSRGAAGAGAGVVGRRAGIGMRVRVWWGGVQT